MLTPALIFLAVVSLYGASHRVIEFPGGRTSVDPLGDVDHVLVQDLRGNVTSESTCDSGRFSDYYVLFIRFRDAIVGGDREAVLRLLDYPFRVNGPKPVVFKTEPSLSKRYADVFTAEVQQKIRDAQPAAVFCKNGQATLGAGLIWANRSRVAILNLEPSAGGVAKAEPPRSKDLVLVGKVMSLNPTGGELRKWIVTVEVDKVVRGEFSGKTLQFAVRSSAKSLLSKGRSYTIEAIWTGEEYSVDHFRRMNPPRADR